MTLISAGFSSCFAGCLCNSLGETIPMKFNAKTIVIGVLGVSAFLLGILGFLKANPGYSVATAMLASLQLFALNSGTVDSPVPWTLEIARWAAVIFSGSAAFGLLRNVSRDFVVRSGLILGRLPFWQLKEPQLCVVVGLGRKGISLMDDLKSAKAGRYRLLGVEISPDQVAIAREKGFDVLQADGTAEETLKLLPWRQIRWIVFLMGRDEFNLAGALSAIRLRRDGKAGIALHIPSLELRNLIYRQNALSSGSVRMFNFHERLARQVLLRYPVEALEIIPSQPGNPLLGLQGVAVAQEQVPCVFLRPSPEFTPALIYLLARGAHFPMTARRQWKRIRVVIADVDAERTREQLCRLYPALARTGESALIDLETLVPVAGESAPQAIACRIRALPQETPVTVFLDIHDPKKSLVEALALLDAMRVDGSKEQPSGIKEYPGFRCLFDFSEEASIREFIQINPHLQRHLLPVPSISDCCGASALFDHEDRMDAIARRIHEFWSERSRKTNPAEPVIAWSDLSHEMQESNRAVADHFGVLLRHLGKSQRDVGFPDWIQPAELEILAECEHRRWSAQKLMDGWVADPSLGEDKIKEEKRHGCIDRPYDTLSVKMKNNDRNNVLLIHEIFRLPANSDADTSSRRE